MSFSPSNPPQQANAASLAPGLGALEWNMDVLDLMRFSAWALMQKKVFSQPWEQTRLLQERRFRQMLRFASNHSAYYRERFQGLDLDRCRLSDLPITTKAEMMDHFDEIVTDPTVRRSDVDQFLSDPANTTKLFLGKYAMCHTSGSQGQPLSLLQDRKALEVLFALQMTRGRRERAGILEALRRLRDPFRIAVIAMRHGFYPSNAVWTHMPPAAQPYVRLLRLGPTDPDLVDQLNAFRPNVVAAYPSTLELLAMQKQNLRLAPELRQVVSSSEELTPVVRQRFQQAFGVTVLNNYAMGECNHLSIGCPESAGAHINADWAMVELVDEHYQPVPPGTPSKKVLITNLANEVQPVIRYEIHDTVVMATEPCPCGNPLPKLERIEGRSMDFFWVPAGQGYKQVPSFVFKNGLEPAKNIREWQAIQEERDLICLRLELLPNSHLTAQRAIDLVNAQLASLGLMGTFELEIEFVARLGPDPKTGKVRRIISKVGPPEDLEASFQRPRFSALVSSR